MATTWDEGLYPAVEAEEDKDETYLKMLEDCGFPRDEEDEHVFN